MLIRGAIICLQLNISNFNFLITFAYHEKRNKNIKSCCKIISLLLYTKCLDDFFIHKYFHIKILT